MWIARDKDGSLHMFRRKPKRDKKRSCWGYDDNGAHRLNSSFFENVQWTDEEPVMLFEAGNLDKIYYATFARKLLDLIQYSGMVDVDEVDFKDSCIPFAMNLLHCLAFGMDCKLSEINGYDEISEAIDKTLKKQKYGY